MEGNGGTRPAAADVRRRPRQMTGAGLRGPWLRSLLVAAIFLTAGCTDGGSAPHPPSAMDVTLESPNGPEGALLVELDGTVGSAETATGHLFRHQAEGRTQLLLVLETAGEIRFRLGVPDGASPPDYRIIEVSGPDDRLRDDLSAYRLSFQPPGEP